MDEDLVAGVDLNSQSALILRKLLILQSAKTAKKAKVPILSDIFLTLSISALLLPHSRFGHI
jgi:hypothetical protein